ARHRFWELIRKLAASGQTVFVTTHYMDEAENCGRIALMRSGELIALDSPENLKKTTFQKPLYNLTPKKSEMKPDWAMFDVLEPYGQHYHAVFKNEKDMQNLKKLFEIQKIKPSLEDVFIELVEGQNR
ncbi:MAG: ABC transporter ATP-binding protein, partial [Alphaproteobacteria bacterium]